MVRKMPSSPGGDKGFEYPIGSISVNLVKLLVRIH
jgi:hypothetical protein